MNTHVQEASPLMLLGPKVQYADGKVVTPKPFDLDHVLVDYLQLSEDKRRAFLSIFSHSLTVDMRVALLDRPISDANADRAWQINEWLHHLTSCFNPTSAWRAEVEAELIRNIAIGSFRHGLDGAVGRAVATAAGSVMASAKKKLAAATAI
jgi:hypothetical protein